MKFDINHLDKTYIIAEMSANHAGSIERAKEIIRKAKEAGADCIKIQTYTPDTLTIDCHNEYFNIQNGTWEGENLYSLYGKAYTPWAWQKELKEEADRVGIDFLSTPFDNDAIDFLDSLGADIITTSLGYFDYDDSTQSYSLADLDGRTAPMSRAAAAKSLFTTYRCALAK